VLDKYWQVGGVRYVFFFLSVSSSLSPLLSCPILPSAWDEDILADDTRIEDNILVTKTGYQNLTTVPKDPVEVEGIIRSS
jgi:hypothetical protein